jgi:hypothetical protein
MDAQIRGSTTIVELLRRFGAACGSDVRTHGLCPRVRLK